MKMGIEPEAGIWSLTLMAWGGLFLAVIPTWVRIVLFLVVGAANSLLTKEVRELKDRAK